MDTLKRQKLDSTTFIEHAMDQMTAEPRTADNGSALPVRMSNRYRSNVCTMCPATSKAKTDANKTSYSSYIVKTSKRRFLLSNMKMVKRSK